MLNTIQFLKNYDIFASQARYYTARLYLDELKNNKKLKPNNQKLMKLRIIEELVSATEDFSLWLLVISKRLDKIGNFDIWERLLVEHATSEDSKNFLNEVGRLRSYHSILKKLNIIDHDKLSKQLGLTDNELTESLEYITKSIRSTIQNRKVSNGALIRVHNKIKHGMAVYLDNRDINNLLIRDFKIVKVKNNSKLKRKHNRYYKISFDEIRAEELVNNILVISDGIRGLIYLVLADFKYRITTDIKLHKKTKSFWLSELDRTDLD